MKIMLLVLLVLIIVVPAAAFHFGEKRRGRFKAALAVNLTLFFGVLLFATAYLFAGSAMAAEEAAAVSGEAAGIAFIAAAIVTSVATVATGIAVATSASAALGALSENDKIFGKAIIFVAMAEGIALYGLLVSFMILGKV